jgi:hypothetical protein
MQTITGHPLVAAASLALLPAVISWLTGRGLATRIDDRSLPERLHFHQQRTGVATGIAMVAIGVISPAALLWAVPLLFTTVLLVGYPIRRTLFEETWSAGAYLSFFYRLIFGIFGFWIVLAALPFVASLAGTADWLAGAVMAAVLVLWERH